MRLKKIYIIALSVVMLGSCNKKLDELLVNPNSPSPDKASADLYLTQMQLSFANFFDAASSFGMETTRMIVMYGPTYNNAYSPQSFDGIWSTAYTGVLKHANALIPIAESEKKFVNSGMAKTLKAYTMMTLVDIFGDIPSTEANLGSDNTNPAIDKGQDVYARLLHYWMLLLRTLIKHLVLIQVFRIFSLVQPMQQELVVGELPPNC